MMETQTHFWEETSAHSMPVKYESIDGRSCKDEIYRMSLGAAYCEGNLNFATASEDDEVYTKKKVSRQDPMSHRIIEKRRRDRMNNCLADLSRLIPAEYLKKGRGRVEKTEIIEMAIRHMKHLQSLRPDSKHHTPVSSVHSVHAEDSVDSVSHPSPPAAGTGSPSEHYRLGFQECLSEMMHFLVEVEGFFARDNLCVQLLSHLQQHCDKILATSDRLGFPHPMELPTMNGVNSFAHVVNGIPSMCPTSNGIHLSNNNNNNSNTTNGNLHHNVNNNNNNNNNGTSQLHQQQAHQHTLLQHNSNSSSDRCSSSGVSSFDPSESRAPRSSLIPPPNLVSDDSNHSSHSHGSSSLTIPTSTTSSGSGSNNGHPLLHHHHHESSSRPSTNYKFKNSIKQRFSADQRIKTSSSPPPSEASPKHGQQQGVPIFALHDNGGFYVPLTLEAALLRPHMGYPSPTDLSQDTVLHPVTISVNFNHPSPPTWSHPSPTHQMQQ